MNNYRREQLKEAIANLEAAKSIIETVQEEEQESYDNLSEGLQQSGMGETLSENAETLANLVDDIDIIIDSLSEY